MPDITGSGGSLAGAFRQAIAQASLGTARPSYRLRGPAAQYRQLNRTRLGRQALEQAGVTPSAGTRARWLSHTQRPSRANTEAIHRAYAGMQHGGIPEWVKSGKMRITGRVQTGDDVRDRGTGRQSPLLIDRLDLADWDHFEDGLAEDPDDAELESLISKDLIMPVIGGSDEWEFPGDSYLVKFSE